MLINTDTGERHVLGMGSTDKAVYSCVVHGRNGTGGGGGLGSIFGGSGVGAGEGGSVLADCPTCLSELEAINRRNSISCMSHCGASADSSCNHDHKHLKVSGTNQTLLVRHNDHFDMVVRSNEPGGGYRLHHPCDGEGGDASHGHCHDHGSIDILDPELSSILMRFDES